VETDPQFGTDSPGPSKRNVRSKFTRRGKIPVHNLVTEATNPSLSTFYSITRLWMGPTGLGSSLRLGGRFDAIPK